MKGEIIKLMIKLMKYEIVPLSSLRELNLNSTDRGLIKFDDEISGTNYTINVDGDESGKIEFNNALQ